MLEIRLRDKTYLFVKAEIGTIEQLLDGIDGESLTEEELKWVLETYRLYYTLDNYYLPPTLTKYRESNGK